MAKAVFYIRDKVQEVGYRVFVMERILESSFRGGVVNTPDGGLKIILEGRKKDIIACGERLRKEMPELAENPVFTGPEFDESLEVPDEIRLSHALEMNQFGKAVVYLSGIDKKLDELPERIGKKFDDGFNRLGDKIEELPNSIGKKLDELPEKIAKAMAAIKNEGRI